MSAPPRKARIAADMNDRCEILRDLLSLVMARPPSVTTICLWSGDQREHAEEWAQREMLSASDNPVQRILPPPFLNGAKP